MMLEEIVQKISGTEAKIAIAESNGDIAGRDRLKTYLVELQKEKNFLLHQQRTPAPGNIFIL